MSRILRLDIEELDCKSMWLQCPALKICDDEIYQRQATKISPLLTPVQKHIYLHKNLCRPSSAKPSLLQQLYAKYDQAQNHSKRVAILKVINAIHSEKSMIWGH